MADTLGGDELLDFLRSLGATDEQIETARRECNLARLPTDLVLGHGADLSADELAVEAGVDVEVVLGLWRTLGILVPDERQPMFSERDARFTCLAVQLKPVGTQSGELFRVLGSSLARVAEAAVSLYVQTVEPTFNSPDVDVVVWAKELAATTTVAMQLGDAMGTVFAHHLQDAIERQRTAQLEVSERSLFRLAVGFVDLVGFTPLSQHAAPSDLVDLIGGFEARAYDVAAAHQGRIVKHIGDEVMFVALDAGAGCAIARQLTASYGEGIEPRGGVAFGEVITRYGDYYGPVVNLASRLADLAIPKEVLVDSATATAGRKEFEFYPAGRRQLKGFDHAVEVFSLGAPLEGS